MRHDRDLYKFVEGKARMDLSVVLPGSRERLRKRITYNAGDLAMAKEVTCQANTR